MKIPNLAFGDFQEMTKNSICLAKDSYGDKVLLGQNNTIYKIFRRKRFFSSALFFPYAVRFFKNAKKLKKSGIPTVEAQSIFYIPDLKRHLVTYPALSGMTLREKLKKQDSLEQGISLFLELLCNLHSKGIYYRSLHFGNIFVLEEGKLALIDISDMMFWPWPLWLQSRAKNFRHFLRYAEDIEALKKYGWERFVKQYADLGGFSLKEKEYFFSLVKDWVR
ncbi:MAG: toluene tolerance protein [Candidatus Brocadiae bacterium]|nr:toluene tolerance protein [Candidatus Brocadiia bacterium]